jgi:glutaredoxin-like YruB-family protein
MKKINSHKEFLEEVNGTARAFLLLYKTGNEQGNCAYKHMEEAAKNQTMVPVFAADVSSVRDIHPIYGITSAPSLLIFENSKYTNVVKGCQDMNFYKALFENAIYYAKAKAEGKEPKRVTVYTSPSCSWCNTLKSWLGKNKIPFSEIDVSRDEKAARDLVSRSGQQGVPQTEINGQIVVGFDQQKLKELLEIQ